MFKRYAYWEKHSTGWGLVVFHDHMPGKSNQGQEPERQGPYVVPQEMIDIDGSPNLGLIEKAFPRPAPVVYDDPPINLWPENQGEEAEPEWPLPEWAERKASEGKLSPMQQLFTRNSAHYGNATLAAIGGSEHVEGETQYLVVTDANNWMKLTPTELDKMFEAGPFILKTFPNPLSTEDWNVSQRQTEG